MATRTVACPECGSESAPGRYTCGKCGALLDGVAVRPRPSAAEADPGRVAAPAQATRPPNLHGFDDGPADIDDDDSHPVDEDRPLMSAAATVDKSVDRVALPEWPVPEAEREVSWPEHQVSWPAPADRRPVPAPEPRVAAGTALPPSAVLLPLDPAATAREGASAPAPGAPSGNESRWARPDAAALSIDLGARASAAVQQFLEALGPTERRAALARRTVATGVGVALLGFILPWASAPLGLLAANWLDLWGLAGGGNWLIVLGLVALGLVATRDRTATWPIAIPGLMLGALLLGLVWPYVLGSASRPFGTLVVFVGAIVLLVGSWVGLTGRHEDATPAV